MADDIVKLGFSVETKELVKAEKQLDKVADSGAKVEKSGGLIARSMGSAGSSASKSGGLISKSMNAAGTDTQKSGGLISKSMTDATYRIKEAEEASQKLSSRLELLSTAAKIGFAAVAAGVAALATIAIKAIAAGAEVSKLSASLNMSAESLTAWQHVSEKTFGNAEKIADVFKDMNDRVGDFASTGGGPLADVMKVTNLNIRELINLAPDEQLLKVYEALDKIDGISKAEKTFYLESLASDASMLTPLLDDNAAGLRKMQEEAKSLGLVIDSIDAEKFAIVNGELSKVGKIAVGAGNAVGTALAPILYAVTKEITDMALGMGGFGDISKKVVNAALVAVGYLANGYQIIEKLLKGIQVAALYVGQKAVAAFAAMGEAGAQVANFVLKPITKIIETISASWSNLLGGLAKLGGDLNPFSTELKSASDSLSSFSQKASGYKVTANGVNKANRDMALSLIAARGELIAMGKADPYSAQLKKWYNDSETSLTAQAKAALALKSATRETGFATHALGKELEAASTASDKAKTSYQRELESLTQSNIAKTQGAEQAYRYSLSLQKITGSQADLLVSLKRQSGAFDEVKAKAASAVSAYDREAQSLTQSVIAKTQGAEAAYRYGLSLQSIVGAQADLLVGLKRQSGAFDTAKVATKSLTEAEKYRNQLIQETMTAIQKRDAEIARVNNSIASDEVKAAKLAQINAEYAKQADSIYKASDAYKKSQELDKQKKQLLDETRTALEKYKAEVKAVNDVEGLDSDVKSRKLKALKTAYDANAKSVLESSDAYKKQAESAKKTADENKRVSEIFASAKSEVDLYTAKLTLSKEQSDAYALSVGNKLNPAQAEKLRLIKATGDELESTYNIEQKYISGVEGLINQQEILQATLAGGSSAGRVSELTINEKYTTENATDQVSQETINSGLQRQIELRDNATKLIKEQNAAMEKANLLATQGAEAVRLQELAAEGLNEKQAELYLSQEKIMTQTELQTAKTKEWQSAFMTAAEGGKSAIEDFFKTMIKNAISGSALKWRYSVRLTVAERAVLLVAYHQQ